MEAVYYSCNDAEVCDHYKVEKVLSCGAVRLSFFPRCYFEELRVASSTETELIATET